MKPILLIVGLVLSMAGCAEKEQAAPSQQDDAQMATEVAAGEPPAAEIAEPGTDAFIRHMHAHARRLDRLNAALASGDLDAAQTPAYWLSRHEGVQGPVDDWQPHIEKMRDAAQAVTDAPDLDAARVAAERISDSCRACHAEAGVDVPSLSLGSD